MTEINRDPEWVIMPDGRSAARTEHIVLLSWGTHQKTNAPLLLIQLASGPITFEKDQGLALFTRNPHLPQIKPQLIQTVASLTGPRR